MTTTPLPPAIEPVAWFEYARKKPTLKRLVFDCTSRSQLRVAGWVSEPLVKESDATQARADLEAENQRLRGHLENLLCYDSYDQEYDGRMFAICPSCGGQEGEHTTQCEFEAARAELENKS